MRVLPFYSFCFRHCRHRPRAVLHCRERKHSLPFRLAAGAAAAKPPPPAKAASKKQGKEPAAAAPAKGAAFGKWEQEPIPAVIRIYIEFYRLRLMPPTPLRRVPSLSESFQSLGTIYLLRVGKGTPHRQTDRQTDRHTDRQIVCGLIRQIFDCLLASVRHDLVTNSDPSWGMLGSI